VRLAAGIRNFVRLLVACFARARFAGPLLRKGEAVRKGEAGIIRTHGALLIFPSISQNPKSKIHYTKRSGERQAIPARPTHISASYADRKYYKFDLFWRFRPNEFCCAAVRSRRAK
jgi:hypothetical protein